MEASRPTLHHIHLPPMDARITPPPEEMSPVFSKDEARHQVPELPLTVTTPTYSVSDGGSTTSSTRRRHRRGTSTSRTRPRLDVGYQPSPNAQLIFSPRPYENLYVERAYLSSSLQKHEMHRDNLMRYHISALEQMQYLETAKERKHFRKRLSLLKSKMNAAVEQQRAIFNRLGELFVEIQSRESLAQASQQQWFNSMDSLSIDTPSAYSAMSPWSYGMHTPITPLNAMSPEFVPQGYFGDAWPPLDAWASHSEMADSKVGLETVDEAAEDMLCSSGLDSECYGEGQLKKAGYMRRMSCEIESLAIHERRLSLPCLQTVWPEE
ncbi:hypothetical protein G7046_g37 [Stylonectria norvegica]|nr:hypothetical protein G7046_g37 [Stylonectria norvegica]